MATKIVTKNSSTASAVPTASDLVQGELAVNVADKRLFTEDNAGAIVELGTNPSALTVTGNVGIGTSSPAEELDISADAPSMQLSSTNASGRNYGLQSTNNGKFSFYDGTAGVDRMVISSDGSVGIGTSSPSQKLEVHGAVRFGNTVSDVADGGRPLIYASDGSGAHTGHALVIQARDGAGSEIDFVTGTTPTTRMRIDSSGNVGIGISPAAKFDVLLGSTSRLLLRERSSRAYIDSVTETNNAFDSLGINGSEILFETGGTERMRIDPSGHLLVGTTTAAVANGTTAGIAATSGDQLLVGTSSDVSAAFNRISSDGDIVLFRRDGTSVGSIGYGGGGIMYNAASNYGLKFYDDGGANIIHPATTAGGDKDDSVSLGYSGARFKDLYLSGDIAHKDAGGTARLLYDKSVNLLGNAGTNVEAYNVTVNNGIQLGGTGAANKLDDYEEGTWTPNVAGVTLNTRTGTYTKIGNLVYVGMFLHWPTTSDTTAVNITGFPFACKNDNNSRAGLVVSYSTRTTVTNMLMQYNATYGNLRNLGGSIPTNADMSGRVLHIGGVYQTA